MHVVVVHWNQPVRLRATLAALADQGVAVRALVVDNGSAAAELDAARAVVASAPIDARLFEAGTNTGFGPGANIGLRVWLAEGVGEWAAVVPHDALPDPGALAALIAMAAAQHHVGLACADVGDGETPVVDPYFGGMTVPARVAAGWEPADYPHGTLLLARRACLEAIGLFDERYFAYCEEADLGVRARELGWRVGLVRGARVTNTHLGSSVALVDYLQHRNTLLLVRVHSGRYHAFIRLCISIYQLLGGWAVPSRRPLVFDAPARWAGIRDHLRRRYGPPPGDYLSVSR